MVNRKYFNDVISRGKSLVIKAAIDSRSSAACGVHFISATFQLAF